MTSLLDKYGVVHRIAIAYHPQTNGQAKNCILNSVRDVSLPDRLRQNRTSSLLGSQAMQSGLRIKLARKGSSSYPEEGVSSKLRSRWDGPFVITNVFRT
ncbi:hypothetical protein CR513_19658, partial [Mucuna pruriens]